MEFSYSDELICLYPTPEESTVLKPAIIKYLFKSLTDNTQIEANSAWVLLWYLGESSMDQPLNADCLPAQISGFIDALTDAQADLKAEEMPIAAHMLAGMLVALEGFTVLQANPTAPKYVPDSFS